MSWFAIFISLASICVATIANLRHARLAALCRDEDPERDL